MQGLLICCGARKQRCAVGERFVAEPQPVALAQLQKLLLAALHPIEGDAELLGRPGQVGMGLIPGAGAQGIPELECPAIGKQACSHSLNDVEDKRYSGFSCTPIIDWEPDAQTNFTPLQ